MSTIRRAIAAGLLALPLTLAAGAGLASADTYTDNDTAVGSDGAATHSLVAGTYHGTSYYYEFSTSADDEGASTDNVASAANPWGDAGYVHHSASAGEDGVATHNTTATTGGDYYDNDNDDDGGLLGLLN